MDNSVIGEALQLINLLEKESGIEGAGHKFSRLRYLLSEVAIVDEVSDFFESNVDPKLLEKINNVLIKENSTELNVKRYPFDDEVGSYGFHPAQVSTTGKKYRWGGVFESSSMLIKPQGNAETLLAIALEINPYKSDVISQSKFEVSVNGCGMPYQIIKKKNKYLLVLTISKPEDYYELNFSFAKSYKVNGRNITAAIHDIIEVYGNEVFHRQLN